MYSNAPSGIIWSSGWDGPACGRNIVQPIMQATHNANEPSSANLCSDLTGRLLSLMDFAAGVGLTRPAQAIADAQHAPVQAPNGFQAALRDSARGGVAPTVSA